jgi:thiol-disulfide isomerase/thioredoxin
MFGRGKRRVSVPPVLLPSVPAPSRRRVKGGVIGLAALAVIVPATVLALEYSGNSPTVTGLNIPVPRVHLSSVIPGSSNITPATFGGKAVVLNFWASWCPPCQQEMPMFEAVHRQLGNRVSFVGIDESDTRSSAIAMIHQLGVTYPNGFDGNGDAGLTFVIPGTPTTYFISHGREVDFSLGELSASQLRTLIRQQFGLS